METTVICDSTTHPTVGVAHSNGATGPHFACAGDAVDRLVAEGKAAALASNTRKAYRTGWRSWCLWASERGIQRFPASSRDFQKWLAALSVEGKTPTTLSTYLSAVGYWHRHSAGPNPAHCSEVRELLAGLRRQAAANGFRPRQAAPLRRHHVERIVDTAHRLRRNQPGGRQETRAQARRRAIVDIAMIALAHDALLRCSELLALTWADVDLPAHSCGTIVIRRSKTDQTRQGAAVTISEFTTSALARLKPANAQPNHPIFDLSPNTIARRMRAAAKAAGIDPTRISTHSPRVGMAQDLVAWGIDMPGLLQAGRWKTPATAAHYTQHLAAHHTPAAQYLKTPHHSPTNRPTLLNAANPKADSPDIVSSDTHEIEFLWHDKTSLTSTMSRVSGLWIPDVSGATWPVIGLLGSSKWTMTDGLFLLGSRRRR